MMDEQSKSLWARVCATVNKLGAPRSPRPPAIEPVVPRSTIDLHGMTVQQAYRATREFLSVTSHREVTIITGKSGVIRSEFPIWIDQIKRVASYEEQNGGGAFSIRVKPRA